MARDLYRDESFGVDLSETVYAFDSTTIDLCLSLFPWAQFRRRKSAVKLHTLLDLRGSIPTNVYVTGGQVHDVNLLDQLLLEAGSVLLARPRLCGLRSPLYSSRKPAPSSSPAPKRICSSTCRSSRPVDRSTGLRCDQTIRLTGIRTAQRYPDPLRRIVYFDAEKELRLIFLTNNFHLPPSDHRPTVSGPLAGGIVLPLDQTAPAHQGFLRHLGERREDASVGGPRRFTSWWPSSKSNWGST